MDGRNVLGLRHPEVALDSSYGRWCGTRDRGFRPSRIRAPSSRMETP